MKMFLTVSLIFLASASASPSFAEAEQCRLIKAKSDREACYDHQSKALAEKGKAASAAKSNVDHVDELKKENDQLTKRLRSICRGC